MRTGNDGNLRGYWHPFYALSLSDFGQPIELRDSGGWMLRRCIDGTGFTDAMGTYPIFACQNWASLGEDLQKWEGELAAVSLVTDPFGDFSEDLLRQFFPDVMRPFKQHFVVELSGGDFDHICDHHRRNIKKAIENDIGVSFCENPVEYLKPWCALYNQLVKRHRIKGVPVFSLRCFERQLQIPGTVLFKAEVNGEIAGMIWWFVQDDVAYYHLGAYSELGYATGASFGLFWHALNFFNDRRLKYLNLGAGAGSDSEGTQGLKRFKSGWATGTRTAFFCGKILNREHYESILKLKGMTSDHAGYFPIYRLGESS